MMCGPSHPTTKKRIGSAAAVKIQPCSASQTPLPPPLPSPGPRESTSRPAAVLLAGSRHPTRPLHATHRRNRSLLLLHAASARVFQAAVATLHEQPWPSQPRFHV